MARANPERSFEVSARHLFRHLSDAAALRRNPLLRSAISPNEADDCALVAAIHARIVALADLLCKELSTAGLRLQAVRRLEIVKGLCAGESPAQTAVRLRLSRSQYYRERNAIATAIARALRQLSSTGDPGSVVREDPLRLLFKRAELMRDAGRARESVLVLEDAYSCVSDDFRRSTIGLSLAQELVFLGQFERARALLAGAVQPAANGHSGDWLRDVASFFTARLQSQFGSDASAGDGMERLAKQRMGERRVDDVTLDSVFLAGEGLRNAGRYAEARTMLRHLQKMDRSFVAMVPKRGIAIALLTAWCAEGNPDELGIAETSLHQARELSVSSGSLVGALLAISGVMRLEASRHRDDAAYAMAHEALRMSRGTDFDGFMGYVAAEIVATIVQTRYWRAAAPLLFEADTLTASRPLALAIVKHAQGTYFLRAGRLDRARRALKEAIELARDLRNHRLEGLALRDIALTLDEDSVPERSATMRDAVALIERYGRADDLPATYRSATRVLHDARYVRLARVTAPALEAAPAMTPIDVRNVRPLTLRV
jgi:tetratricopeptide (TPR) repeat protein